MDVLREATRGKAGRQPLLCDLQCWLVVVAAVERSGGEAAVEWCIALLLCCVLLCAHLLYHRLHLIVLEVLLVTQRSTESCSVRGQAAHSNECLRGAGRSSRHGSMRWLTGPASV